MRCRNGGTARPIARGPPSDRRTSVRDHQGVDRSDPISDQGARKGENRNEALKRRIAILGVKLLIEAMRKA
jgi:hypothetical protein